VLKQYRPEVIRFFVLSSHYRSPLNYSDEQLDDAGAALTRLYTALRGVDIADVAIDADYRLRFEQAMDDDFNTPVALAVLFDLARELNKAEDKTLLAATLKQLAAILGLLQDDPDSFLKGGVGAEGLSETEIEQLIDARKTAKANKDWSQADGIRDRLKAQGVVLEDVAGGNTIWRREN
jgi:cysteinyl-tRNA synthetase